MEQPIGHIGLYILTESIAKDSAVKEVAISNGKQHIQFSDPIEIPDKIKEFEDSAGGQLMVAVNSFEWNQDIFKRVGIRKPMLSVYLVSVIQTARAQLRNRTLNLPISENNYKTRSVAEVAKILKAKGYRIEGEQSYTDSVLHAQYLWSLYDALLFNEDRQNLTIQS